MKNTHKYIFRHIAVAVALGMACTSFAPIAFASRGSIVTDWFGKEARDARQLSRAERAAKRAEDAGAQLDDAGRARLAARTNSLQQTRATAEDVRLIEGSDLMTDVTTSILRGPPLPFIGHEREIHQAVSHIRGSDSFFVTGPTGSGKDHMIKKIAQLLANSDVDDVFSNARVIQINGLDLDLASPEAFRQVLTQVKARLDQMPPVVPNSRQPRRYVFVVDDASMFTANQGEAAIRLAQYERALKSVFGQNVSVVAPTFTSVADLLKQKAGQSLSHWFRIHMSPLTFEQKAEVRRLHAERIREEYGYTTDEKTLEIADEMGNRWVTQSDSPGNAIMLLEKAAQMKSTADIDGYGDLNNKLRAKIEAKKKQLKAFEALEEKPLYARQQIRDLPGEIAKAQDELRDILFYYELIEKKHRLLAAKPRLTERIAEMRKPVQNGETSLPGGAHDTLPEALAKTEAALKKIDDDVAQLDDIMDQTNINKYDLAAAANMLNSEADIKELLTGRRVLKTNAEIEENVAKRIIGQKNARLVIQKILLGHDKEVETQANYIAMILGPSGVGKTELAKLLAEELDIPYERLFMGDYKGEMGTTALKGAAPGFIRSDEGSFFIRRLAALKKFLLLIDEPEAADEGTFEFLQKLLDEGRIVDSTDRVAEATESFILHATNLLQDMIESGDLPLNASQARIKKELKDLYKKGLSPIPPKYLDRIHWFAIFGSHTEKSMAEILVLRMRDAVKKISDDYNLKVEIDEDSVGSYLLTMMTDTKSARDVANVVSDNFSAQVKQLIKERSYTNGLNKLIQFDEVLPPGQGFTGQTIKVRYHSEKGLVMTVAKEVKDAA